MKSVYIETYGCQMNLSDTEIVQSVLKNSGFNISENIDLADVILLNTCSVRENAERKIFERLKILKKYKKHNPNLIIGIIGCMAERMKEKLVEKAELISLIVGPDEYRRMPELLNSASDNIKAIAVNLSKTETYDDILPLRNSKISAFISIMRGCNNFCSYCVVPYTRGRERSRPLESILAEIHKLIESGIKEITFLGQNVNSYYDLSTRTDFPNFLYKSSQIAKNVRLRFITSHPKDLSSKLIEVIASSDNICKHIHLPIQSGSNRILELMNRGYTSENYKKLIDKIKNKIPEIAITTDIISGFPSESLIDHRDTLNIIKYVAFDGAFMFKYSPRDGTKAFNLKDDVPEEEKLRRLNEIINLQLSISRTKNISEIGKIHRVLVEGKSKRSLNDWKAITDTNKTVVFSNNNEFNIYEGSLINIQITNATSASLKGKIVK